MAKSIIQDTRIKECFLCREEADKQGYYGELTSYGLHKHHFIFGRGKNRKKAEHYGLWAYLCNARHHEYGQEAPHVNAEVRIYLSQVAQAAFEKKYSRALFTQEFGKNWLDEPYEEDEQ